MNLLGAVIGGVPENLVMIGGTTVLGWLAIGLYALAALSLIADQESGSQPENAPLASVSTAELLRRWKTEFYRQVAYFLLHIGNFSILKRDFQIFVNINLFCAQVYFLVRLPHRCHHLIRRHPQLNTLGLGLWLCSLSLRLTSILRRRLSTLICALLLLLPATGLLLIIRAHRKKLPNRIFHLGRVPFCQRSLGKHKHHIRLVVGWRIDIVALVAGDDSQRHRILFRIHIDLRRINFVALGKQLGRLLLAEFLHAEAKPLR